MLKERQHSAAWKRIQREGVKGFLGDLRAVIKSLTPKPDDPKSTTPCSKCLGLPNGCTTIASRNPKKKCKFFVEYDDGTKRVIGE